MSIIITVGQQPSRSSGEPLKVNTAFIKCVRLITTVMTIIIIIIRRGRDNTENAKKTNIVYVGIFVVVVFLKPAQTRNSVPGNKN